MYQAASYDQRDGLIREHLQFVNFVVHRMRPQIPGFISMDELKSAAMQGLMDAAGRFDPGKGVLFKTFAETRIRGAVLDEIRKMDWFSRTMREKHNRVYSGIRRLEQKLGRDPSEDEIADEMNISLEEYQTLLREIGHLGIVSLHEVMDRAGGGASFLDQLKDCDGSSPEDEIRKKELIGEMADAIDCLSEKERLVVTLFYYEEFTQKEIASVLDLSEGRISQLHSQALLKLKVAFQED